MWIQGQGCTGRIQGQVTEVNRHPGFVCGDTEGSVLERPECHHCSLD